MPRRKKERKRKESNEDVDVQHETTIENDYQQASKNSGTEPREALPINEKFAERYEESKRRQLLSTIPVAVFDSGDESSSTSEEEDEFGELLTKGIDRRVKETLEAIRNKDPRIYNNKTNFFEAANDDYSENDSPASDAEENSEDEPVAGWDTIARAAEQVTPKLTIKDYVRETLLNHGKLSDDDDEGPYEEGQATHQRERDTDDGDSEYRGMPNKVQGFRDGETGPIIAKQTRGEAFDNREGGKDDSDDLDNDNFFTKKEKTAAELEEEEKDFEQFMKRRTVHVSKQAGEDLLLHSYLEKETPDEKERFLRDFVLNNGWLDKNAGEAPRAQDYEIEIDKNDPDQELDGPEEEDKFDEKVDNFEAQYNFRFEEPEGAQIVSHARSIPDSMRRPDDRRKRAREARRRRKDQEKAQKVEEIKQLKNLKKREIQARLLAIQEAAGDGVDLTGIDLDADFDPEAFNKQMESKFGADYYSTKDDQMKSVAAEGMSHASEKALPIGSRDDIPDDIRGDVKRMTDEYYNLNFEDIVGGVPMRFKYKRVEPESFNMAAEDILNTDDKELNRLVSLKYLAPYRSRRDVQKQAWQVRATLQKRKRERPAPNEEGVRQENKNTLNDSAFVAENDNSPGSGSRRRKRRKSKSHTENVRTQHGGDSKINEKHFGVQKEEITLKGLDGASAIKDEVVLEEKGEKPSGGRTNKKNKRKSQGSAGRFEMSARRLKAYGITPS